MRLDKRGFKVRPINLNGDFKVLKEENKSASRNSDQPGCSTR